VKRLKYASDSNIEKLYLTMCEAVAEEIKENSDDYNGYCDCLAQDTIKAIKNQQFLSDFEKTVRDYFKEKNMPLNYETLVNDIDKFI